MKTPNRPCKKPSRGTTVYNFEARSNIIQLAVTVNLFCTDTPVDLINATVQRQVHNTRQVRCADGQLQAGTRPEARPLSVKTLL